MIDKFAEMHRIILSKLADRQGRTEAEVMTECAALILESEDDGLIFHFVMFGVMNLAEIKTPIAPVPTVCSNCGRTVRKARDGGFCWHCERVWDRAAAWADRVGLDAYSVADARLRDIADARAMVS